MKLVLLTSDSPWQRALAVRCAAMPGITLAGIVINEMATSGNAAWLKKNIRRQPGQVASRILQRLFFRGLLRGIDMEALHYFGRDGQPLPWPDVDTIATTDINGPHAVEQLAAWSADAIAVSGTKMIKAPIFAVAPPLGLVNLHTGISPFYKGGPNCTLWCLANGQPQFIGSTIHRLDLGIDSGDLLLTEQTTIEAGDTVAGLVSKAIVTGHDLYARVLGAMAEGAPLAAVPQNAVGSGRTYMTREWNVIHLAAAARYVRSGKLASWVRAGRPGLTEVALVDAVAGKMNSAPDRDAAPLKGTTSG